MDTVQVTLNRVLSESSPSAASPLKSSAVLSFVGDFTQEADVRSLVDRVLGTFGKIDVVINCIGTGVVSPIDGDSFIQDYDKVMAVNVRSILMITKLAVPSLVQFKGCIINVSSAVSKCPMPGFLQYCVSKTALDMVTKCLAVELGPRGVRVNAINPGVIATGLPEKIIGHEGAQAMLTKYAEVYPLRRIGSVQDTASALLFLASAGADFITGVTLPVDGGHLCAAP